MTTRNNRAVALIDDAQPLKAIPLLEELWAERTKELGETKPATVDTLANLAAAHQEAGHTSVARELFQKVYDGAAQRLGTGPPTDPPCDDRSRAGVRGRWPGRRRRAVAVGRGRRPAGEVGGRRPGRARGGVAAEGEFLLRQGRYADAESPLRDCLTVRQGKLPDTWKLYAAMSHWASP